MYGTVPSLRCQPAHTIHAAADYCYSLVGILCYNTLATCELKYIMLKTQINVYVLALIYNAAAKESLANHSKGLYKKKSIKKSQSNVW